MKETSVTVVLANLMSDKGELNEETASRLDLAVKIDSELQSDVLLLCGWAYRPDCPLAIADAMKTYILAQSPELAAKIVCQRLSRDTVGDAVFARLQLSELFGDLSSVRLNVITSDYHVARTQVVFDFVFFKSAIICVTGAPGFGSHLARTKEMLSLAAFRKTFSNSSPGDINSIYSSLRRNHPFYNGAVYPRIEEIGDATLILRRS